MRIGIYVSVIDQKPGYEKNVSGHVQVPLHAIKMLSDAGHEVHLLTTEFGADRTMPFCMPEYVKIHFVPDARRRAGDLDKKSKAKAGVHPLKFIKQLFGIKRIVNREKFDVIHFFGYTRTAQLAAMAKSIGMKSPVVLTLLGSNRFPQVPGKAFRYAYRRMDCVVSATHHVKQMLQTLGFDATVVRHGTIRDVLSELGDEVVGKKTRILYWRDPSQTNGADLALAAFEKVADKYPQYTFDFAIRPYWNPVNDLDERVAKHENMNIFRFPYPPGTSLAQLLKEAMLVIMPFRSMSIDPQLAIAESLAAGIPVIATDMRSNPELVIPGKTGELVPFEDVDGLAKAIDRLLSDPEQLEMMGTQAAEHMRTQWTWDRYAQEMTEVYQKVVKK